jgi:hypothetical protein
MRSNILKLRPKYVADASAAMLRNITISSRYWLGACDPFLTVMSMFDRSYLAGAVKHTDTDDVIKRRDHVTRIIHVACTGYGPTAIPAIPLKGK